MKEDELINASEENFDNVLTGLKILLSGQKLTIDGFEVGAYITKYEGIGLYTTYENGTIQGLDWPFTMITSKLNQLDDEQIIKGLAGVVIRKQNQR